MWAQLVVVQLVQKNLHKTQYASLLPMFLPSSSHKPTKKNKQTFSTTTKKFHDCHEKFSTKLFGFMLGWKRQNVKRNIFFWCVYKEWANKNKFQKKNLWYSCNMILNGWLNGSGRIKLLFMLINKNQERERLFFLKL